MKTTTSFFSNLSNVEKVLVAILVLLIGCALCIIPLRSVSNFLSNSEEPDVSTQPQSATLVPTINPDAWIPSGFYKWNDEIAVRWVKGISCSYGTAEACSHAEVFARYGCPTSLYVEVAFTNKSGTQVDWSNDTSTSLSSGTKALLEFVSFNSSATRTSITQILCY
jgi:hypothetical protein